MAELAAALAKRRAKEEGALWASPIPFPDDSGVRLFLGSGRDASNLAKLHEHGITHILNVADDVPNFHEGEAEANLEYCNLNVVDFGGDRGISRVFKDAEVFVRKAAGSGGCVLVHCANGSNRSATVVIALQMVLAGLDLRGALAVVRQHRASATPLRDNRQELLKFEKKLLGENSMKENVFFAAARKSSGAGPQPRNTSRPPDPSATEVVGGDGLADEVVEASAASAG